MMSSFHFISVSLLIVCLFGGYALLIWYILKSGYEAKDERLNGVATLVAHSPEMTSDAFFGMRILRAKSGNSRYAPEYDFPGVAILHNKTRDVYYIEQGHIVLNQTFKTFAGQGNEAVYSEFGRGDEFTIKIISLEESTFDKLNDLEKYTVEYYDATRGKNRVYGDRHPPEKRPYDWSGQDPNYPWDYEPYKRNKH